MSLRAPQQVARDFHERVKASCWNPLLGSLLLLHQPVIRDGRPGCQGCDQAPGAAGDPAWPCRTYLLIVAGVLKDVPVDMEAVLLALTAQTEQHTRTSNTNSPARSVHQPQPEPA